MPVAAWQATQVIRQQNSLVWSRLLRHVVLPSGDLLFGQRMMRRLRYLSRAQWWDRERICLEQDRLLQATVRTAYNEVPFYRRLWREAHVDPAQIRTAADLVKLPIVTKSLLKEAYPDDVTRRTRWRSYEARTSGSTGENFCVREDTETAGWYRATLLLQLGWAGWKFGEPHMQTGMNLTRGLALRLKDSLLHCHYIAAGELRDDDLDRAIEKIERYQIRHLWGYPGSLYMLARRAEQLGWNTPFRSLVTWGDNLDAHYRSTIQSAFGCRVLDTYGCCEGMHIAAQCERRDLYHVHMLDVIAEIVNQDGEAVPSEVPGNFVITRLHAGPMPLIRYRIGDMGTRGAGSCACGRGFETIQSIEGRDTDYIVTPDGNRLIVHFFTGILEHFPQIASYQVIQHQPNSMTLRFVPTESFRSEIAAQILTKLRGGAGDMEIRLEPVDAIPLTAGGKRRFVINHLSQPPC